MVRMTVPTRVTNMWSALKRRWVPRAGRPGTGQADRAAATFQDTGQPLHDHSLAVLPFKNRSDPDDQYFGDGLAEEILNLLAKLPELRIAPKPSSFAFRGGKDMTRKAADELGVDVLLEGSIRRSGKRVRIKTRLVDARSGKRVWSKRYDGETSELFAFQDDITQHVTDALGLTLTPRERRTIHNVATSDAGAYDDYLRGRSCMARMTRDGFIEAVRMFRQAIDKDPKYALAWAGVSDGYAHLYRFAEASRENALKARRAGERAVELDTDSSAAHASYGLACFINQDYGQAEREFERAAELNPNIYEPYYYAGLAHTSQGNFERAAEMYGKAMQVNPSDYQPVIFLAQAYASLGRREEEKAARKASIGLLERHIRVHPDDTRALCLAASQLHAVGDSARGERMAEEALARGGEEPLVLYNIACFFAVSGDRNRAFQLLENAISRGWGDRAWLETDSDLESLREDGRFLALLDRIT